MGGAFDGVNLMPRYVLRDAQAVPPVGYCARCGAELYSCDEGNLCSECNAEINSPEIVVKYAEAWPQRWFRFLREEKHEDYVRPILNAFRDYCQGPDCDGPDIEDWARS